MSEPIVLFGGTFDPVHIGHLIIARAAVEQMGLSRVTLLPAASPPHKGRPTATAEQRLEMLRRAIGDDPTFDICEVELGRCGPSYTIDTIEELRREHGGDTDIRLIIGGDMLEDLPNWHRAAELVEQVGFIVAARRPWDERWDTISKKLSDAFGPARTEEMRHSVAQTPVVEVSSTQIRQRIRDEVSIRYLTTEDVVSYIIEERLYCS
jgi:nicotinate-nucleotide adenylyltransferase